MSRRQIGGLILLASLLGGCSAVELDSPSAPPSAAEPSQSASPGPSASERPPSLPSGFPALPGAVAIAIPSDDPGLIGLWETDELGSAAYDFYVTALPAAGYPIIGLYPGGAVAIIRFRAGDEVWQMVAHGAANGGVAIEIRLDRP